MLLGKNLIKNFSPSFLHFNMSTKISFQSLQYFNFATKMRQGVSKKTKDSAGRRLGIKKYGGEEVRENTIILRQRGLKWKAGENVHVGKDHTIHSSKEGIIKFTQDPWSIRRRILVHVVEQEIPNRKLYPPKPFMYHPELYPELAANNVRQEPLEIRPEILHKLKCDGVKAEMRRNRSELTILQFDKEDKEDNLSNVILKLAKTAKKISKYNFSSRFEVNPIIKEIAKIGIKYLTPDHQDLENDKTARNAYIYEALKNGEKPRLQNALAIENETFDDIRNTKGDLTDRLNELQNIYDKESNNLPKRSAESVRDIMVQMKKDKQLSKYTELQSIPYQATKIDFVKLEKYYRNLKLTKLNDMKEKINFLLANKNKITIFDLSTVEDILDDEDIEKFLNGNSTPVFSQLQQELVEIENKIKTNLDKMSQTNKVMKTNRKKILPGIIKNLSENGQKRKENTVIRSYIRKRLQTKKTLNSKK